MCRVRGFTLLELLTVVAVTAVLAALAAPSFIDQLARRRLEGVAVDLSTDLHFARSQAVSDRNTVQLITEVGGTQYRVANAAGTTLKTVVLPAGIATTDAITVTYDQLRGTSNAAEITLTSTRTAGQLRLITNAMGRVGLCSPNGTLKGYTTCP